ncbi:hypothetical protein [Saccharothrix xinjiangensis]|uniref:Uncharacterized protein n=1 Tax=Saccharothrix xinjiangensis TaxID=204798 RepID=A0ABV9XSV2_9PSEU
MHAEEARAGEAPPGQEFHRYLLKGTWNVVTAVTPAGDRVYVLPQAVRDHLAAGQVEDLTRHPGLPPVTDALREEARRNPGGWVWCADPDVDPRYVEGAPSATLLGAYRSGPDGLLTGEVFPNPDYRPSPRRSGFPEPRSEFDLVLGYVAVGRLPRERVLRAVLDSPLVLETDGSGGLRVGVDQAGRKFIAAWSAPGHVPPGDPGVGGRPRPPTAERVGGGRHAGGRPGRAPERGAPAARPPAKSGRGANGFPLGSARARLGQGGRPQRRREPQVVRQRRRTRESSPVRPFALPGSARDPGAVLAHLPLRPVVRRGPPRPRPGGGPAVAVVLPAHHHRRVRGAAGPHR